MRRGLEIPESGSACERTPFQTVHAAAWAALGALALGAAAGAPAAAGAAEPRVARIGYLANEPTPDSTPVLRQALRDLGWVEGRNVTIWFRYAQGRFDRFPGQVDELIRLGADVLV